MVSDLSERQDAVVAGMLAVSVVAGSVTLLTATVINKGSTLQLENSHWWKRE